MTNDKNFNNLTIAKSPLIKSQTHTILNNETSNSTSDCKNIIDTVTAKKLLSPYQVSGSYLEDFFFCCDWLELPLPCDQVTIIQSTNGDKCMKFTTEFGNVLKKRVSQIKKEDGYLSWQIKTITQLINCMLDLGDDETDDNNINENCFDNHDRYDRGHNDYENNDIEMDSPLSIHLNKKISTHNNIGSTTTFQTQNSLTTIHGSNTNGWVERFFIIHRHKITGNYKIMKNNKKSRRIITHENRRRATPRSPLSSCFNAESI